MNLEQRKATIKQLRHIARKAQKATGDELLRLFDDYNSLRVRIDGERVPMPRLARPVFVYDAKTQMMRT